MVAYHVVEVASDGLVLFAIAGILPDEYEFILVTHGYLFDKLTNKLTKGFSIKPINPKASTHIKLVLFFLINCNIKNTSSDLLL